MVFENPFSKTQVRHRHKWDITPTAWYVYVCPLWFPHLLISLAGCGKHKKRELQRGKNTSVLTWFWKEAGVRCKSLSCHPSLLLPLNPPLLFFLTWAPSVLPIWVIFSYCFNTRAAGTEQRKAKEGNKKGSWQNILEGQFSTRNLCCSITKVLFPLQQTKTIRYLGFCVLAVSQKSSRLYSCRCSGDERLIWLLLYIFLSKKKETNNKK